ncbi:MAG: hypothetical protein ACTSVI_15485, partial [Promethearchaeota archaeon]
LAKVFLVEKRHLLTASGIKGAGNKKERSMGENTGGDPRSSGLNARSFFGYYWDIGKALKRIFNRKINVIMWVITFIQCVLVFNGYSILTFWVQ